MELFCVKPTVHLFDRFVQFAQAFSLGRTDMILTESVIYENYIRQAAPDCFVLLKDRYGPGEPREEMVDSILQDMAGRDIRRVIAVGGGSVIDIAKVICVHDAYPIRRVMCHEIPIELDKTLIVLPTTCGTGSEVTFGGIITMADTGFKTAIMDPVLSSTHAVLVPELLQGLPYPVFVNCSVDALGHAMESYVSATRGNEMARAVGARAIRLLTDGYCRLALEGPQAQQHLLKNFLTASCLAGMAVNNGGAGPVHALGYPLGEKYKMSHGESIRQFLTEVFCHYERTAPGPLLAELGELLAPALAGAGVEAPSPFQGLDTLLERVHPSRPLSACGMTEADVEPFVENIFQAKQRLLAAAYGSFTPADAAAIYRRRLV